jgi:hypothetical protein
MCLAWLSTFLGAKRAKRLLNLYDQSNSSFFWCFFWLLWKNSLTFIFELVAYIIH